MNPEIKQIRKKPMKMADGTIVCPPYLTIVDTGLAMAIQWFLGAMYFEKIDPDQLDEWPQLKDFDTEYILELNNRLCDELQKRTY